MDTIKRILLLVINLAKVLAAAGPTYHNSTLASVSLPRVFNLTSVYNSTSSGNETVDGLACLSSSSSWSSSSQAYYSAHRGTFTSYTVISTSHSFRQDVSAYTLCDGVPRVSGIPVPGKGYVKIITLPPAQWSTSYRAKYESATDVHYSVAPPSCSIDPDDCLAASASWLERNVLRVTDYLYYPVCDVSYTEASLKPYCQIWGEGVHLRYWPSTLIQSSTYRCDAGTIVKETVAPTDTGVVTAVVNGTTYTSPTVYISFDTVRMTYPNHYVNITSSTHNIVISIDSKSLFSQVKYGMIAARSFNFLDLTGPVPVEAYQGQDSCTDDFSCLPIFDNHSPAIYIPTEIRTVNSKFLSCIMWPLGLVDPPIALQRQPELMKTETITPISDHTSEPALPGQLVKPNQASQTAMDTIPVDPTGQASPRASTQPVVSSSKTKSSSPARATLSGVSSHPQGGPQQDLSRPIDNQQDPNPTRDRVDTGGESASQQVSLPSASISLGDIREPRTSGQTAMAAVSLSQHGSSDSGVDQTDSPNHVIALIGDIRISQESKRPGQVFAGTQVLNSGEPNDVMDHTTISLDTVVGGNGGNPYTISNPTQGKTLEGVMSFIKSQFYRSDLVPVGSSLSVGGPAATIHGQVVSAVTSGIIVGDSTRQTTFLPPNPTVDTEGVLGTAGSQIFTGLASDGKIIIDSSIYSFSGLPLTFNDHIISARPSGLVIEENTLHFSDLKFSPTSGLQGAVIGASSWSQFFTGVQSEDNIIILGDTLSAGGLATTFKGQVVSVADFRTVFGGSTIAVSAHPTPASQMNAIFMLGSPAYAAAAGSVTTVGSATGQTTPFPKATDVVSSSAGLGALIMQAFREIDVRTSSEYAAGTSTRAIGNQTSAVFEGSGAAWDVSTSAWKLIIMGLMLTLPCLIEL